MMLITQIYLLAFAAAAAAQLSLPGCAVRVEDSYCYLNAKPRYSNAG